MSWKSNIYFISLNIFIPCFFSKFYFIKDFILLDSSYNFCNNIVPLNKLVIYKYHILLLKVKKDILIIESTLISVHMKSIEKK